MEFVIPENLDIFDTEDATERCGVILVHNGKTYIKEIPNVHEEPEENFMVLTRHIKEALENELGTFAGVIHTHPKNSLEIPSQIDVDSMPSVIYGITYHPYSGTVSWYTNEGIEHTTKIVKG